MRYDNQRMVATTIVERVGDVVVAKVLSDGEILGVGEARLAPDDKFDFEVGMNLAAGRAFDSAGKQFLRIANGLVKHHDDMREQKARQQQRGEKMRKVKARAVKKGKNNGKKTTRA